MKLLILSSVFLAALSQPLFAAPETIYGPQRFSAAPNTVIYPRTFTNSKDNADGVLTIISGNGDDLTPVSCPKKPILTMILCKIGNIGRQLRGTLERPSQVDILLNNKIVANYSKASLLKGKFQTGIKVKLTNALQARVRGLWTSYISVEIKADTVNPNQPPIASFIATPTTGIAPELITFSGLTSSDPDGSISTYSWDFGDGNFSTGSIVNHTFQTPGNFIVKLTVQDDQGAQSFKTHTMTILQNQPPIAQFSISMTTNLGILNASFDASSSLDHDGNIIDYAWNFGDDNTGSGARLSHIYALPGSYTIELTLIDDKGGISKASQFIEIQDRTAPLLTVIRPISGSVISGESFTIQGTANEELSQAQLIRENEAPVILTLSPDRLSFFGDVLTGTIGSNTLKILAKDTAGNSTEVPLELYFNSPIFWSYQECSTQDQGL